MFKTIVVAVDGSEGSKRAIPIATELAKRDDAKVVLAHIDERIVGKGGGDIHPDEDQIQADVKKLAEELSSQGIETDVQMADVMVGGPAHPIAEIADRANADLIVAGTRGPFFGDRTAAGKRYAAPASPRQAAGSSRSVRIRSARSAPA